MSDVIINIGNGYQYFPSPLSPDFAYRFARGSDIWACLLRYPNDFSLDEGPAIFRSTNGGASWALQNDSGAPISNKIGPTTVTYDSRFNYIAPASEDHITFVYAENPSTAIYTWHTCDFNFDTHLYGAPYGSFTVDRPKADGNNFSSRPDGSMITVYSRQDSSGNRIGCFYRIFSGGWGGEQTLEGGASAAGNLAVDAAGNSHIITRLGNYYRIDASNAVVAGPISVYSGTPGNLTIAGGKLYLAYASGGSGHLATGTPLAAPTWSTELVGGTGISGTNTTWVQQIGGSYALDVEFDGAGLAYTIDSTGYTANGLTYSWISGQNIMQSIKSGAGWSAPETIWTASPTAAGLFSLAARGTSGRSGNRSYPIF